MLLQNQVRREQKKKKEKKEKKEEEEEEAEKVLWALRYGQIGISTRNVRMSVLELLLSTRPAYLAPIRSQILNVSEKLWTKGSEFSFLGIMVVEGPPTFQARALDPPGGKPFGFLRQTR